MNMGTIKGKLVSLAALSIVILTLLGFLSYNNNINAQKTTDRMILLGNLRAQLN